MHRPLPIDTLRELEKYRTGQHPHPLGSFLTAILANDLVGAFRHADGDNIDLIEAYASYLYNQMPCRSHNPVVDMWGSYKAVSNTIARQCRALTCTDTACPIEPSVSDE
jgi:hypothetical protein